jgi:hypothetical protein
VVGCFDSGAAVVMVRMSRGAARGGLSELAVRAARDSSCVGSWHLESSMAGQI